LETNFITKGAIREFIHENDFQISGEVYSELERKVAILLLDAIERAKFNGRTTVLSGDL